MIALLENNQRGNGTIGVPAALRPYLGGIEAIGGNV
jgi:seryl-tRNA synthetase